MDLSPLEELQRLGRITSVPHIAALNRDHLDDGVEHGRLEERIRRQADGDDGAARTHVLGRLLEGLLEGREQQHGVRAHALHGRGLDVGDEVLRRLEVDVGVGAQLLRHGLLLGAAVDGDDVEAHGLRVLAGQGSQAAAGADDGDGLTGARARLLQALVDGDAGAEDGGDGGEVHGRRDARDVGGLGDGVLLEGAVDGVAGEDSLGAEGLVGGLAEGAGEAGAVEPLDAGVSAERDVRDEFAAADDDAGALVAADQRHLGREGPVAVHGVEVTGGGC